MLFFLLIAACIAEEVALGFNANATGSITIKLDPTVIKDKCIATKYLNIKITNKENKYYAALYKDAECKTVIDALKEIPLTVFDKAAQLPIFQEGLTIKLDGTATGAVTVAYPYGCLLSMIPNIDAALKGNANLGLNNFAFVHTQFGVSVHSYDKGKCEGNDTIKEIFTAASEDVKKAIIKIGDTVEKIKESDIFAAGIEKSKNRFEYLAASVYNYTKDTLPKITDNIIYEFNGTAMKIYEKVGNEIKYLQDALKKGSERIINILKNGNKEILITGDCDGGFQFGWNGETFQQLQVDASGKCDVAINDKKIDLNLKAKVTANSNGLKIKIDGIEYEFNTTNVKNALKDAKTAIVETFGTLSEYELNVCKEIDLIDIFDSFKTQIISVMGDQNNLLGKALITTLSTATKLTDDMIKEIEKIFPDFLKFSYMIKPLEIKIGEETKYFATFDFYLSQNCAGNNLFDLIAGVIDKEKIGKAVETGYSLVKYLDKEDCNKNKGIGGFVKEHVNLDVCVNGYIYSYKNEVLSINTCQEQNKKQAQLKQDIKTYPCGTCVECLKEQGVIGSNDTVFVKCGASGIFSLLLVFLIFVLF